MSFNLKDPHLSMYSRHLGVRTIISELKHPYEIKISQKLVKKSSKIGYPICSDLPTYLPISDYIRFLQTYLPTQLADIICGRPPI